jgi:hypothetical protein
MAAGATLSVVFSSGAEQSGEQIRSDSAGNWLQPGAVQIGAIVNSPTAIRAVSVPREAMGEAPTMTAQPMAAPWVAAA